MAIRTKKLPEWKSRQVEQLAHDMQNAATVAVVDIKGMPGKQFHNLRAKLRKDVDIKVIRKTIILHALDKLTTHKKNIEQLKEKLGSMPAVILSKEGPFQISKLFMENKAPTFAKAGDIAPRNIEIDEGPTPFTPGPMISELSGIGLKVKVDSGKIVVMQKSVVAKEGMPIKQEVADILVKLGIQPMEVGLDLNGAWENSFVFNADILHFDAKQYLANLSAAANMAFSLSVGLPYPTKENISILVSKAHNDAKALALGKEILADAVLPMLMAKAEAQAAGLNNYITEHKG
ncbi:MAG: 50S ribosomal protein L10 [Candidatus Nanoarchaeia archaeon]|nr:50S ribosomal protein L10 [Candidatus Nanoarchaeia archaeon]MDD5239179.1 50S ribosomal protein L10 [Candidatus Nanoarchaeia archaeon]